MGRSGGLSSVMSAVTKIFFPPAPRRTPLPRSSSAKDLGRLYEAKSSSYDTVLVPPDETWQGGIMQLYRAAKPVAEEILRGVTDSPFPPRCNEDRSCDESGVDGVGYLVTECTDPANDASCFVQPSQESLDFIKDASKVAKDRLVMLHNPQWRDVDDALDSASKTSGFLGGFASFLGGKGATLKALDEVRREAGAKRQQKHYTSFLHN